MLINTAVGRATLWPRGRRERLDNRSQLGRYEVRHLNTKPTLPTKLHVFPNISSEISMHSGSSCSIPRCSETHTMKAVRTALASCSTSYYTAVEGILFGLATAVTKNGKFNHMPFHLHGLISLPSHQSQLSGRQKTPQPKCLSLRVGEAKALVQRWCFHRGVSHGPRQALLRSGGRGRHRAGKPGQGRRKNRQGELQHLGGLCL